MQTGDKVLALELSNWNRAEDPRPVSPGSAGVRARPGLGTVWPLQALSSHRGGSRLFQGLCGFCLLSKRPCPAGRKADGYSAASPSSVKSKADELHWSVGLPSLPGDPQLGAQRSAGRVF